MICWTRQRERLNLNHLKHNRTAKTLFIQPCSSQSPRHSQKNYEHKFHKNKWFKCERATSVLFRWTLWFYMQLNLIEGDIFRLKFMFDIFFVCRNSFAHIVHTLTNVCAKGNKFPDGGVIFFRWPVSFLNGWNFMYALLTVFERKHQRQQNIKVTIKQ